MWCRRESGGGEERRKVDADIVVGGDFDRFLNEAKCAFDRVGLQALLNSFDRCGVTLSLGVGCADVVGLDVGLVPEGGPIAGPGKAAAAENGVSQGLLASAYG